MRLLVVVLFSGCAFHDGAAPGGGDATGATDATNVDGPNAGSDGGSNAPPFVPSHVGSGYYHPDAHDLSGVIGIDTSTQQLDLGSGLASPPTGVTFVNDGAGHAVLSVGAWTVDQPIKVTGTLPLVVVAAGAVEIDQVLDASAQNDSAGPGGGTVTQGTAGPNTDGDIDSGGGGGGFGTDGA